MFNSNIIIKCTKSDDKVNYIYYLRVDANLGA